MIQSFSKARRSRLRTSGQRKADAEPAPASQIAETPLGPIEYSVVGKGPAVLVIHGCPGGYDQGLIAAKLAKNQAFRFIAVSRPGYLRTPLSVGASPAEQADAYAALLDALHISAAAVMGISGGGPSALQFALRHPERCWGLVTLCAISERLSRAEITKCKSVLRRLTFTAGLLWGLTRDGAAKFGSRCRALWNDLLARRSDTRYRPSHRQEHLDLLLGLLRTFGAMSARKVGLLNDTHQLMSMPAFPLEKISAPTLVLHGTADRMVSFSHAEKIVRKVPRSRIIAVESGNHLFFATHRERVVPAIFDFLRQHAEAAFSAVPSRTARNHEAASPSLAPPPLAQTIPSETV